MIFSSKLRNGLFERFFIDGVECECRKHRQSFPNLSSVLVLEDEKGFRVFHKPYGYLQQPALLMEVLYSAKVLIVFGGSANMASGQQFRRCHF